MTPASGRALAVVQVERCDQNLIVRDSGEISEWPPNSFARYSMRFAP